MISTKYLKPHSPKRKKRNQPMTMLKLIADQEKCKGCACVITVPCFQTWNKKDILIDEIRYVEDEVINRAVNDTINACPLKSVKLIIVEG